MKNSTPKAFSQPHSLKLAEGKLSITLDDCSDQDLRDIQTWLEQQQANPGKDYSAYFDAILGSKMYKPANPSLAIYSVAKAYQLDPQALSKAFKQR